MKFKSYFYKEFFSYFIVLSWFLIFYSNFNFLTGLGIISSKLCLFTDSFSLFNILSSHFYLLLFSYVLVMNNSGQFYLFVSINYLREIPFYLADLYSFSSFNHYFYVKWMYVPLFLLDYFCILVSNFYYYICTVNS